MICQSLDNNKSESAVSKLNIKNILDLSQQDMKIVTEIKKFMKEQETDLLKEIQSLQDRMMQVAMEPPEEDIQPSQ